MQIKTYADASTFVHHLQEAQQQGQRIRLGQKPGTLEVFEAPSRTFGRDSKAQYEVDQTILQEQQALGDRLNELVSGQTGISHELSSLRSPAVISSALASVARPPLKEEHQALVRGLREVLTHLQTLQHNNPSSAPQALPLRLMQVQQLLEHPQHGQSEEAVARALSLLNAEVSSLRIMVPSANDPKHPVGAFCNHVRQSVAQRQPPDMQTGLRPGLDVLASTDHPKDPHSFRRFFSRAAQAIATLLDQPQIKHMAQRFRHILDPLTQTGLRSSHLQHMAEQAGAMQHEVVGALQGHPMQAAAQRVFETIHQADFLAMENLLTTELLEVGQALADHGQVDLAHEMLTMGRKLASQSDLSLKDMADTVAVLRLILPQLQALASQPAAFAPETSASQAKLQLSPARCEADRQCVKDFVAHFSALLEPAPLGASEVLAVQSALVRHPEWQVSQEVTLSTAGRATAVAPGTTSTELQVAPSAQSSHAELQTTQATPKTIATPAPPVVASLPDRDLVNADLLIQDLAEQASVLGTPWRQEAQNQLSRLREGLRASEQQLNAGSPGIQQELAYQQSLHQHLSRVEDLLQTSDSQRVFHTVLAAHSNQPQQSLADQLAQRAPDLTAPQFMGWLDGQLINARARLAVIQPPASPAATPEAARLLGVRQALEIGVQQLQRTRDDAVALWGNGAAEVVTPIALTDLQGRVQQALVGSQDIRPDTLLDPKALGSVQGLVRQQVDDQLRHRLQFGQAPVLGLNDADFAAAIGLQAELDYLGSSTDEMVMLQAWAMRAAQGWESSEVGETAPLMADALQGAVGDLRSRIDALRDVTPTDNNVTVVRTTASPNGGLEEVFEAGGAPESPPAWLVFASEAAAQALEARARMLDNVSAVLRASQPSLV